MMKSENLPALRPKAWLRAGTICLVVLIGVTTCSTTVDAQTAAAQGVLKDSNRQGLGTSVRAGHVAGDAIGRYDSVSLFELSPYVNIGNGLLFGDARLVYGNEGGIDYSFGGGYRHYVPAWDAVAGANIFSDRGDLSGTFFRSWGVGAELLAHGWEARVNGYSPYRRKSVQTGVRADSNSAFFEDNIVRFDRIDSFREALHGFDAEIGWLLPGRLAEQFDVRAFGGGYWYKGENVDGFSGFTARLQTKVRDILELGIKLSDDERFHTNVTFTAMLSYGGFHSQEHTRRSGIQRMAEPVRRNLNVPVINADVTVANQIAQAADGTNLTIIHVNSNAAPGGTGTVTDPFDMLSTGLSAAHPDVVDVVFIHAGSQFSDPANNSVALGPNQNVFGEGLIRVDDLATPANFVRNRQVQSIVDLPGIGPLILPNSPTFETNLSTFASAPAGSPLTPGVTRPILRGAAGNSLTLNTNSRAAGLILDSPSGHGIVINGVGGTDLRDMLVTNAGNSGISISGTPTMSTTTITNTVIENLIGTAPALDIAGGGGNITFATDGIANDPPLGRVINSAVGAPVVQIANRIGGSVNMSGSAILDDGGSGIIIRDNSNTSLEAATLDIIVDNFQLNNSTSTGISISNPAGTATGTERYIFQNSSDPTNQNNVAHIANSTDEALLIRNVPDGSQVRFVDLLNIQTPGSSGIAIDNLGGSVFFNRDVTIGSLAGAAAVTVAAPGVSVVNSQSTGLVQFTGDLTVGSTGLVFTEGILLNSNASGSRFSAIGNTLIGASSTNGIAITDNDSDVAFSQDVLINNRQSVGIRIDNTTGNIVFGTNGQQTTIENNAVPTSTASGLIVNASEANVHFEHIVVNDSEVSPAVSLTGNRPGITARTPNTAILSFDNMTITSATAPSPGLFANDNELIIVRNLPDGPGGIAVSSTIDVQEAPAVDITDSGINITFERVSTVDSPTFGINLVRTNVQPPAGTPNPIRNRFRIRDQTGGNTPRAPGAGGLIENSAIAGLNMVNAGQVELNDVVFLENTVGIEVVNSGITIDENQFLELHQVQVTESELLGLRAQNLHRLVITDDSFFELNGDVVNVVGGDHQNEAILLRYTEHPYDVTATEFDEITNPYEVIIQDNNDAAAPSGFEDNTDDIIRIVNEEDGDPATEHSGAAIDVLISNNRFQLEDTFDLFFGQDEAAVRMTWDGIARVEITDNNVVLNGDNLDFPANTANPGSQTAFLLDMNSRTDWLLADVSRNNISAPTQLNSTGVRINSEGPLQAILAGNVMQFGGADGAGFRFNLRENDESGFIQIQSNQITFTATPIAPLLPGQVEPTRDQDGSDGGSGIIFERIREPAELRISGNTIALFDIHNDFTSFDSRGDEGEAGILFERTPVGVIDLRGNLNNQIFMQLNPAEPSGLPGDIDTLFNLNPAQANGTISINGVRLP